MGQNKQNVVVLWLFVISLVQVDEDDGDEIEGQKDPFEGHVDAVDYGIYH